jgi:hypothetical protein
MTCCRRVVRWIIPKISDYLRPKLAESVIYRPDVENFIVVHLTTRKNPIGFEIISTGTLDTLLVHPREVFKSAIVTICGLGAFEMTDQIAGTIAGGEGAIPEWRSLSRVFVKAWHRLKVITFKAVKPVKICCFI